MSLAGTNWIHFPAEAFAHILGYIRISLKVYNIELKLVLNIDEAGVCLIF